MSSRSLWLEALRLPWPVVRLKKKATLINACPFDSSGFNDAGGVQVVWFRDLLTGRTETRYSGPVTSYVMLRDGDLVVGMDGDFNSLLWHGGPAALNQRLCLL